MGRPRKTEITDSPTSPATASRYRDERGLVKEIEHKFTEDGLVNWLAMIPDKFIVAKEQFKDKPFEELLDNEKLILLGGFKHVAKIRGFTSVQYNTIAANESFVSLSCRIDWTPNFETEDTGITFESCADAHPGSTDQMFSNFLTTIAENRAFSRCVRNFLNINVLGKEEMQGMLSNVESKETNQADKSAVNVHKFLQDLMNQEGITFKKLKVTMAHHKMAEAETWESLDDISRAAAFECMDRIKNRGTQPAPPTPEVTPTA